MTKSKQPYANCRKNGGRERVINSPQGKRLLCTKNGKGVRTKPISQFKRKRKVGGPCMFQGHF